ncbi:MAG: type II secretion system protein GspJ [Thauera propionica]|jgi:general secretion pathway protein J|uniref:type II secretion system protein GspJ n=1 Tax=Thauera propionica TaxID=2019431 RepID=UPI0023F0C135|nr:type II secretion system protein GspJ [Thauera propionica]MDD3675909.1 type II secretion system protein GspJ [Thauera propionica]MDY0046822.1 type II secretion system protein GspJ [Thauera propionica]
MSAARRAQCGLTLIEVVVALSVFAILGVLTWRATDHLVDARQHIGAELERWRTISRAAYRIGTELQQITPAPDALRLSRGQGENADGEATRLSFTALAGPDHLPTRSAFVLVDQRLEWWLWEEDRLAPAPERITLLAPIDAVRWRFLHDGSWVDAWPPEQSRASALPAAISLELELPDAGTLLRVFALR